MDRDGAKVRPIGLTDALVKLAQGTPMERMHKHIRENAEPHTAASDTGRALRALTAHQFRHNFAPSDSAPRSRETSVHPCKVESNARG